jgi:hypothetical protein
MINPRVMSESSGQLMMVDREQSILSALALLRLLTTHFSGNESSSRQL